MRTTLLVLVGVLLFSSTGVFASGLAIPEQGAAAMGMSAAMTARSEDLSAIFYNPAGMDYVENTEFYIGLTPIIPSNKFEAPGVSKDAEKMMFPIPQIYAARRVHEKMVVGLGIYVPFGLGTDWGTTWNGRYTATKAELSAIYINPTVSYQVNDMVSVGLGVSYIHSNANIEKMNDTGLMAYSLSPDTLSAAMIGKTENDTEFSMDGSGSGFNFNIGTITEIVIFIKSFISIFCF